MKFAIVMILFCSSLVLAENFQSEIDILMLNRKPAEQLKIINDSAALTYNLEKKLFYSNYLLKLSQQHSTPKYQALAYLRMGNYYQYKGIFDSSSKYYNASIREAEINKDTAQLITSLIYNALNMIVLKDYEAMIRTTKRAFNLSIITKDTFQSATSAFNISYAYLESKIISKSRQYLDTSFKYLLMVKNQEDDKVKFAWGLYYFYSGQTNTNEGKFEEAIINLTKSEKINDSLNNILIRKPLYANLVLAYSKNNYWKEAKIYSEKILNYDNAYDENTLIALEFLADYYKNEKDFKSENYYLRRIISSKDSLRSNDIRLLNASYEIDRAELKAKQANEIQEENTKNFLIISAIILTGFIIITLVLYNRYKVKKKLSKELQISNVTKSKLFSIISHDLMNPVASLKQTLDLVNDRYDSLKEENRRRFSEQMTITCNNLFRLLTNLLSWSKLNLDSIALNIEELDFQELIYDEIKLVNNQLSNKSININVDFCSENIINADRNLFSVVIRNLLSNALKFTDFKQNIYIKTEKHSEKFVFRISNEGIKISDKIIERLNSGGKIQSGSGTNYETGSGLGLSICRDLINIHNCKMQIKNDTLTEFVIEVPIINRI